MDIEQVNHIIETSRPVSEQEGDEPEIVNLAGFQVTRAELFAHSREPAITLWHERIKFNMACLRRFPGVTHIQILIHPEQKRLIIRPCLPDAPDSLRWARGGGEKEVANRDLLCKVFAGKVFDLMSWNSDYRYKILGKPAVCDSEILFLFRLSDFELFVNGVKKAKTYFPREWRDYFGVPVEQHEETFRIDLADGYITTDKT